LILSQFSSFIASTFIKYLKYLLSYFNAFKNVKVTNTIYLSFSCLNIADFVKVLQLWFYAFGFWEVYFDCQWQFIIFKVTFHRRLSRNNNSSGSKFWFEYEFKLLERTVSVYFVCGPQTPRRFLTVMKSHELANIKFFIHFIYFIVLHIQAFWSVRLSAHSRPYLVNVSTKICFKTVITEVYLRDSAGILLGKFFSNSFEDTQMSFLYHIIDRKKNYFELTKTGDGNLCFRVHAPFIDITDSTSDDEDPLLRHAIEASLAETSGPHKTEIYLTSLYKYSAWVCP
jgi:hypothetical protein